MAEPRPQSTVTAGVCLVPSGDGTQQSLVVVGGHGALRAAQLMPYNAGPASLFIKSASHARLGSVPPCHFPAGAHLPSTMAPALNACCSTQCNNKKGRTGPTMVLGPSSAPEDCRLHDGSLRVTVRAPAPLWPERGGEAAAGAPAIAACSRTDAMTMVWCFTEAESREPRDAERSTLDQPGAATHLCCEACVLLLLQVLMDGGCCCCEGIRDAHRAHDAADRSGLEPCTHSEEKEPGHKPVGQVADRFGCMHPPWPDLGVMEGCKGMGRGGAGEGQHGAAADGEAAVEAALAVAAQAGHLGQHGGCVGRNALAPSLACGRGRRGLDSARSLRACWEQIGGLSC